MEKEFKNVKKFDEKLELKRKQIEKLQSECDELLRKKEEEEKKIRTKKEKEIGAAILRYIEKELNRPFDNNEDEQLISFLRNNNYL